MATQPIEEAVTSAGTNNVSVNSAGQNGTVNSANNDIYKNEGVIAGGKLMYGKTNAWHEADDAEKEKLSNQNANIAKQLNDLYGIDLSRGDDGVWRTADGSNFYDVIGLTNSGTANNAGNANGGNTNASGAVGGTSASGTSGTSGTGGTSVAGVVGTTTKGGYFNDRGQYVITDKVAYNLISEAKNESQKWYTMSPAERQASHTANKQRMDEVSRLTGRRIIYNESDGTYYWENGEKVYDSLFDLEKSHYPEYQDRSAQISETYDTALANQLTANEEARLWQEQLLRANVDNMEKQYDAMARQSYADTARQLENEKLRQALNGERGGVGERQFGIYQSAGSERLYNIELERQKLRSDTEAQIAQLQAEGRIADAQLIAEFALEKDKALQTEADRVYQAEVNKTAYNDSRDDTAFDQTRILNSEREEQRNNEFNRNITKSQLELSWANFEQAEKEHNDDVMFTWIDTYFKAEQFAQDSRQRVFANALALLPYDGGETLKKTFGIEVQDPRIREYYTYAFQAALKAYEGGNKRLMDTVMGDMYDCLIKGGKAVITDDGKFTGAFQTPDGDIYNFSKFGAFIKDLGFDVENMFSVPNDDGGIDIDKEYPQGGNDGTGGNTGGNEGGNENGSGGNEDTSQNTSQNTSDDGGIDLPRDDGGIDIDKATETNERFVNTNSSGKPETSNIDIMQGINTLKNKASNYNMNDPRQVAEFVKSNEYLINSLNVTYKLGITFDYSKKAYVYPDGTKVTDTVLTSVQDSAYDSAPKNIWKQDGGDSKSTTNPNRVGGVSAVKSGQYNSGKFDNYKLGVDADSSGVAKNVPDSAEYLKDGVGNIVTTRNVDSEYLKKNPGTFAVDNGNGTYSYISIKMPDFTIEKTSKGGGFGYKKIGLDGTVLGTPSKDDLKVWFTWDASVGNPDKYAVGSFEREMALKAMYPNYGAETESSSSGSGVNSTGDYTYKGGGNGSGNGSGNGGYNGYTPPETPPEKTTENQWLASVLQSTKTFDEWLNDEGKRFKYSGDDEQNRAYWAYVSSKAKKGGLDEDETYIFRKQVESKNS